MADGDSSGGDSATAEQQQPTMTAPGKLMAADAVEIRDGDVALEELGSDIDQVVEDLTPEDDRRILRRIDLFLLPILTISYMFQFLDKQAMSYTSILGLRTDLRLVGQEYAWAGSIFYFGYLAASYPVAQLLVRLPVGKTVAGSVCLWSVILMCMAATKNARGLLAARFFLGVAEAAIAPGFTVLTSMWYKRSEQPLRHGVWFMGNVASGLFGSLLAYAMGHIEGPVHPWQVLFLVFGAFTLVWSASLFWTLPDTPVRAWFLRGKEEGARAVARVKGNMTGIKNNHVKMDQVVDALTDPQSWLFVLLQICGQIPNGGVTSFAALVISGFGFTTFQTLLINMVAVAWQGWWVVLSSGGATLVRQSRTSWMVWNFVVSLIGTVVVRELPLGAEHKWARFIAGYCFLIAFSANFPMMLSLTAANVGGFTKKTTVNAMMFMAYCVGNIVGPQLFFAREAPTYDSGFLAMLICFVAGIVLSLALRFYYIWENKRRDAKAGVGEGNLGGNTDISAEEQQHRAQDVALLNLTDKTDRQMAQFRYVY